MLTIKELQALMELLNKKEETLERIEEIFLSKFKDSQSVFRASYAISNFLSINVHLNRIPALFLLIENYKHEGISSHPFGATIFQIIHETTEPFERMMASDIIIDEKREEYSRFSVEFLYEKAQSMINSIEERPEVKKLEDLFLANLPQMSSRAQSEVKNVLRDFLDKDKPLQIPEHHINLNGIKESQVGYEGFNIGFMRPLPKFLDIEPSEFHWFSPGTNVDIEWDRTPQAELKLTKAKKYLRKAVNQHLTKDESTEIEHALDSSPNAVLHLQVSPQMILPMVKQTPFLVFAYLAKLSNFPIFDSYLQVFLEGEITLNMVDVVSKIIKAVRIPSDFIILFANTMMEKVIVDKDNNQRDKLARYVIGFIKTLNKMKIINMKEIQEKLNLFMQEFKTIHEVNQLQQIRNALMKQ